MRKKKLNEASISGFIGKFLSDMQTGTQDRFIKQAKKKNVPKKVVTRLETIEKEIADLERTLKEL